MTSLRKYNIVEYKSPTDYLSINDFYKVYAYAYFFKADTAQENVVKIDEITISFVCRYYPKKLIKYLQNERKYSIIKIEQGIYHINGSEISIQLILTEELSGDENMWLSSLTDNLSKSQITDGLVDDYEAHMGNDLYESVMDIIVRANRTKFQEVNGMCKALEELVDEMMHDRIEEEVAQRVAQLEEKSEEKVNHLNKLLAAQNRIDDILKAAADRAYQKQLFREFALE